MGLVGADTGSVWIQWVTDASPAVLTVLPDCPASSPADREPCCEFAGSPGHPLLRPHRRLADLLTPH